MKFILKSIFFIAALGAASTCLFTSSCKKPEPDCCGPTPTTIGTLYAHIHTYVDTTELADSTAPNNTAKDSSGRHIALTNVKLLVSNITLHKANGDTVVVNAYILKTFNSSNTYLIGTVPTGTYTSVSFNVGLDAATNAKAPSSFATSSPLSQTGMWFGSTTQGYKFATIEGMADTSKAGNAIPNVPFSYQLGGATMLKIVRLPHQTFVITTNQSQILHVIADFGKLLRGVNFKTQAGSSTPYANAAAATQIANNIPSAFRYELN